MPTAVDTTALHHSQVTEYIHETVGDLRTTGQALCAFQSHRVREEGRRLLAAGTIAHRLIVHQATRELQQVTAHIGGAADDLLTTGQALCAIPSQRAREEGKKLIAAAAMLHQLAQRQAAREARLCETPGVKPGAA